jgi:hypothetical protein
MGLYVSLRGDVAAAVVLMYDDVSRGIKIMREILKAAKDLHVHATYSQTIYRYMLSARARCPVGRTGGARILGH